MIEKHFMKISLIYLHLIVLSFHITVIGCKSKKETDVSLPPVTLADSVYKITAIAAIDINDFSVSYEVKPPAGESFSNVILYWSTSAGFEQNDSLVISSGISSALVGTIQLKRLNQSTNYYARIGIVYKSKRFYSPSSSFQTGTLSIINLAKELSRGMYTELTTNFNISPTTSDTSTKIYLNNVLCNVVMTNGRITAFVPPTSLLPKKYAFRFERNGLSIQANDSVEILKGVWAVLTPPAIPLVAGYAENGLGHFGVAVSAQKGYIIPGNYFRQIPWGEPNFGRPSDIWQFDGATKQWTKRIPTNPLHFEKPITEYANNALYVLGGNITDIHNSPNTKIKQLLKFDLATNTWMTLDSLPAPSVFNMVSAVVNNEIYCGLGADLNNTNACCGFPLPSKKFWKYSPDLNSWTTLADFPGDHAFNQNFPTAFVIGTKIYVFFGAIPIGDPITTIDFRQELWEYETSNNSWRQLNLPAERPPAGEKYAIITNGGKAYFITAQRRQVFSYYYGFSLQTVCMEYDPATGLFKRFASATDLSIMQMVYKQGNQFVFQSDAFGYTESISNKTYVLTLD